MTNGKTIRIVSREADGSIRIRDYETSESLTTNYEQTGIDDCSTDLSLRGLPVLRGLIGPMPEGRRIARYETAEVFEIETREWAQAKSRRRRRSETAAGAPANCHFPLVGPGVSAVQATIVHVSGSETI